MKIEELFWSLLKEQPDEPADVDFIFGEPDEPNRPNEPQGQQPQQPQQPQRVRQLNPIQKLKAKWHEEAPGVSNDDMDRAIDFFNRRKNGIRPYKDNPPAELPNLIEITALKVRFPAMAEILKDPIKIRDIQNYNWEQIAYFMDRVAAIDITAEMSYALEGTTEQELFASALQKWEDFPNKLIDENDILVIKIEARDEAVALGRLQNLLVNKYGGDFWCITYAPTDRNGASNQYNYYRTQGRSFYFVLNKTKPQNDRYYVSTIEPIDPNGRDKGYGPFCITPRPNGTSSNKSWVNIVNIHPQLEGKENLFKFFNKTPKEMETADLERINFKESTPEDPNPYDFVLQTKATQKRYVDSPNRQINNKRAFSVLPADLRKTYCVNTTRENYMIRYTCDDKNDPFGILNMIQEDRQLFRYLDEIRLKRELEIPDGVLAIQKAILKLRLKESLNDKEKGYILYATQNGDIFGVMNMTMGHLGWVKTMSYIKSQPLSLFKLSEGRRMDFRINRYTIPDNPAEYFYFLYETNALKPGSPNYMVGKYFDKEDGDEFMANLSTYGFRSFTKS